MGLFSGGGLLGGILGGIPLIGGLFGGQSDQGGGEDRAALIKSSVGSTKSHFSYIGQGKKMAEKNFARDASAARAKYAASGGRLGASWEGIYGSLVEKRDEALFDVKQEADEFRNTESYQLFEQDFRANANRTSISGGEMSVGNWGEGAIYNEGQRENLRTLEMDKATPGGRQRFEQYTKRVGVSLGEYETGMSGSEQEQSDFQSMMDKRIEDANTWYDSQEAIAGYNQSQGNTPLWRDRAGGR